MWHSTEQSWNLLHILHPTVLPKGCEPQVLRESRCNILFMYHISKSPATWKGNNRVQTFCLCPLSFFTHEILRKLPLSPPPKRKKKKANPPICVSAPGQCVQPQRKRRCSFDDMSEGDLRGTAAWLSAEIIPYTSSSSRLMLRSLWLWAYKELLIKMTARTDKKDMIRRKIEFQRAGVHWTWAVLMVQLVKSCNCEWMWTYELHLQLWAFAFSVIGDTQFVLEC